MSQQERDADICRDPSFSFKREGGNIGLQRKVSIAEKMVTHSVGDTNGVLAFEPLTARDQEELSSLCGEIVFDDSIRNNSRYELGIEAPDGYTYTIALGNKELVVEQLVSELPEVLNKIIAFGHRVINSLPLRK